MRILIIIEELASLNSSAAIANWNLAKIIGENFESVDILTLDNVIDAIKSQWNYGTMYLHKKDNLSSFQKRVQKVSKLLAFFHILNGNSFEHQNRIESIREFLNTHKNTYDSIILLSGGFGFSPHQAIKRVNISKRTNIIGVFHDPYPSSSYPIPYKTGSRFLDFFRRSNMQKALSKVDFAVFPSKRLYEWYANDYYIDERKVHIIPHAVDFEKVNSTEHSNIKGKRIVHTGTLLKQRNPRAFLEVFSKIHSELQLDFFGEIHQDVYQSIRSYHDQNQINIHKGRIPYVEAISKLNQADFLLLIESDGLDSPFLPTKFVDYICLDLPIIILSPKSSEITRLVGNQYPFICELNDRDNIQKIISNLIFDEKEIKSALKILEGLKKYFSKENILDIYKSIIHK